jgi:hypothetical protein
VVHPYRIESAVLQSVKVVRIVEDNERNRPSPMGGVLSAPIVFPQHPLFGDQSSLSLRDLIGLAITGESSRKT